MRLKQHGTSHTPGAPFVDFDTAKFQGNLADYTITTINGVTTVVDNVAARDGTDHLMHVERLQFSDQAIVLGGLDQQAGGHADAHREPDRRHSAERGAQRRWHDFWR